MLILLSPAKDLDETPVTLKPRATQPELLEHSARLVERLRSHGPSKLARLMDISPKLAQLNHERYAAWGTPFTARNAKVAIRCFNGEAYRGLDAATLDEGDLRFAQHHLRILSGLYGVLRPLDLMQPYRLEMGTRLSMGRGVPDLYRYWGDRITNALNKALEVSGSKVVLNLASAEYSKAVQPARLNARIITPVFKDRTPTGYRVVMVHAKRQRGAMARHAIRMRLLQPEPLKAYDGDGYRFAPEGSSEDQWVFLRG